MIARTARLVAATVLAAAAGTVLPVSSADAATCSSDTGVSVVVDFTKLGGGIASTCNAGGGGGSAADNLEVDHDLTRVQQFPGAVCRVDNTPADAQCRNMPPADAYWGLFWSDGSGGWTYSSQGVDSLDIPDGGSVAFAWQDGGDRDLPGEPPPQTADEPSSSPGPSQQPSGGGGGGGGTGGGGTGGGGGTNGGGGSTTQPSTSSQAPTAGASPSTAPSDGPGTPGKPGKPGKPGTQDGPGKPGKGKKGDRAGATESASPEASDSASPSDDPSAAVPTADAPTPDDDGLPAWVAPVGIAALFGVAGLVALLRRRQGA